MTEHLPPARPTDASRSADAQALDWFAQFSQQPQAAFDDADFQAWLAVDPDHRAAFERWQADWRRLDTLPDTAVQQLRRQLAADKAADLLGQRAQPRPAPAVQPARPAWSAPLAWLRGCTAAVPRAALAAAVLLVAGGAGRMAWEHWQSRPLFVHDYATGRGQQLNVELPDGSRLRLDTATRVHVALYRQRREVRLPEGQAVFQVHGDAGRPFDVLAGSVKVTVVGTQFAVRHTAGSPVQVAVQEGQVRVSAAGPSDAVLLTAGQQVQADGDGRLSAVGAVPPAGIAPWRDGRVSFDNVPLSQALAEFERYGPTRLAVRDPAVAAMRLSGTFDPRRLDNFRKALPKVLPVRLLDPQGGEGAQTLIVAAP